MANRIENITDQILPYSHEVADAIEKLQKEHGLTFVQAARAVELGLMSMRTDTFYHLVEEGIGIHVEFESINPMNVNTEQYHHFDSRLGLEVINK